MKSDNKKWEILASKEKKSAYINETLGKYKKEEYLKLINQWQGTFAKKTILKTDLHEEAFGSDDILFHFAEENYLYGIDVSYKVVQSAIEQGLKRKVKFKQFIVSDIRKLPYKNNFFDLIVSSSTLDHFPEGDLELSLQEIKRVLKPGGTLILSVNNKHNLNFYFFLKMGRFFKLIPYPVEFYSLDRIKTISNKAGFIIKDTDAIVHIPSPLNSVLLLLQKVFGPQFIKKFALKCIDVYKKTGLRAQGLSTAWFLALKLVKDEKV